MTKADVDRLLKLPAEKRLELAQLLWKSVDEAEEVRFVSIPVWQRQLLGRRLEDLDENPEDEQSWEEVEAELWPQA